MSDPLAPYDAVLLVSYGGPEGPDDVLPFMRNATKGAGIPDERLLEVSGHYQRFGGISPINACNRQLCEDLNERFAATGSQVRISLGNRNWHPYFAETLAEQIRGGARRILTLFTSAYTSYSGCRQYRENLAAALGEVAQTCDVSEVVLDRVRPFANTDGFIEANARQIVNAWRDLGDEDGHVVLVTHSIPLSMACASGAQPSMPPSSVPALFESTSSLRGVKRRSNLESVNDEAIPSSDNVNEELEVAAHGFAMLATTENGDCNDGFLSRPGIPPQANMSVRAENALSPAALSALLPLTAEQNCLGEGWTYLAQHLAVGAAIMERVCAEVGHEIPFDLAFCSRSGPPQAKWLEPDINDHLADLAERGVRSVVAAPIGFLSDHMEVVFDLDTAAREAADELGMNYRRAGTAGTDEAMIDQLAALVFERAAQARGEAVEPHVPAGTFPALGENCGENCCQYPRGHRPRPDRPHTSAHGEGEQLSQSSHVQSDTQSQIKE